jgi:uncharacterized membrane protein
MKVGLLKYWDRIRASFWFLPATMAAGSVALSFATVALDRTLEDRWSRSVEWVYAGGAEGASSVLETIAGSMITVAGVVFSLTLVALTLASSQFGPRLLRNFMRDTANQLVLGTFVSTFLYCLLVLRTIRFSDGDAFVPHLSVTLGLLFAVASLGVLIYFIHHVSVSIQADEIVTRVSAELLAGIDDLFPEQIGTGASGPVAPPDPALLETYRREARAVDAAEDGYLQLVDADALMELAVENDLVFLVEHRPGDYIVAGSALTRVWPGSKLDEALEARINAVFAIGRQRTPVQDVEFTVGQLVEIAVRALSPGVNDPFTAITCVDRLGSALCRLAQRELPSQYRCDGQGELRVIAPTTTFGGVADVAFNDIRAYARSSTAVTVRLLHTIAVVAGFTSRSADQATLLRHAEMIAHGCREGLPEENDRRAVDAELQRVMQVVGRSASHAEPVFDSRYKDGKF